MDRITKAHVALPAGSVYSLDGVYLENNQRSDDEEMEKARHWKFARGIHHNDRPVSVPAFSKMGWPAVSQRRSPVIVSVCRRPV